MRVLVTGGAGFIGSRVVDRLVADGLQGTVVDNLSRGGQSNLAHADPPSDSSAPTYAILLRTIVTESAPEVIFHLAAQIDVRASVADPLNDANINILGTINPAEAARAAHVRKIVFTSSGGSTYGQPTRLPVTEDAPIDPLSPYAVAKVSGAFYLNAYSQLHDLHCTHLALANVYGPRQDPHGEAGVVAIFVQALRQGRPTTVFGDGANTRDYVYVDDVAAAFLLAGRSRRPKPVQHRHRHTNQRPRTPHSDRRNCRRPRPTPAPPPRLGDLRASAIDASRAHHELGWQPAHDLTAGIQSTVDHFRRIPMSQGSQST